MSSRVPPLLFALIDDAAPLPPGVALPRQTSAEHRTHRRSWYGDLLGPLLFPASRVGDAVALMDREDPLAIGLVADAGPAPAGLRALVPAVSEARDRLPLRQVEISVAMRNEDPLPGLRSVLGLVDSLTDWFGDDCHLYAEVPLTWGLIASLDLIAEARAEGKPVAPKIRAGGLAAELFPTPVEFAAVICACRDRDLPFKLAAGAHRGVRRTDPETGLVTHGFLNVLGAVIAAADGAEPVDLAEILGGTDPQPIVARVARHLGSSRPLWHGFGGYGVTEPLADLCALGLLSPPPVPPS